MGQGQPLVYILGHAFKIVTLHLAPFNRDDYHRETFWMEEVINISVGSKTGGAEFC